MIRTVNAACLVVAALGVAALGYALLADPVRAREAALEERAASLSPEDSAYTAPQPADYTEIKERLTGRAHIWRELIPPPPPPEVRVAPPAPPDMQTILTGVTPQRGQMRRGDKIAVRISTNPSDRRGQYYSVGDTINGCTILDITDTAIEFGLNKDGTLYRHTIPRP